MIKVDAKTLEIHFAHTDPTEWENNVPLMVAYHTARLADAMERIADTLENSQIAVLGHDDIVNQIAGVASAINRRS